MSTLSRATEWSNARLEAAGSGPRLQNPAREIRGGGTDQRDPLPEIARGVAVAAEYAERLLRKSNLRAESRRRRWSFLCIKVGGRRRIVGQDIADPREEWPIEDTHLTQAG